ncbi:alpha/beta hydrolase family protein [Fodinicola feengrottensis]|uniref:KANL3/Tex30 alpha/beta hydrolase-like domain-containing protein n=1 Tax=Fodinicola feengrottensis TaxID=435914 RepID=A0ABN2GHH1_9ACTN|nr:alpha/beta family hydrolase [Fodinicola feengrottensis]
MGNTELVPTPAGNARITWFAADEPRAVVMLGHGASTGIDARDLQWLATVLPRHGSTVALVEQPWLVAGGPGGVDNASLDAAWLAVLPKVAQPGLPLISGGRSAGSRVACRTAKEAGVDAVLALAFPLHAYGRPNEMWNLTELTGNGQPTLVVQGGRDPFGTVREFPAVPPNVELVEVAGGDHVFSVPGNQEKALATISDAVLCWIGKVC